MKFLKRTDGFTLIELLVVILIIGILIAVSAPSFLGQTQKAHDSAAQQDNAVAYQNAKAYAVGSTGNSFSGYSQAVLSAGEPELGSGATPVTTVSGSGGSITFTTTNGNRTCTLTQANADAPLSAQVCS
jgi:prepilin-type N-terminal cleavage/methylation domain-containing protein